MAPYVFLCLPYLICNSIPLKELRANNRFREGFRGVIKDSAVSMRPRKLLTRFQWDPGSRLRDFNETSEAVSAVSMRPRKLLLRFHRKPFPRFQWDRGSCFCGFNEILTISDSNIPPNPKPYSKRLSPVNQGPKGDWLMKNPRLENLVALTL
jgi:hypothetical protein